MQTRPAMRAVAARAVALVLAWAAPGCGPPPAAPGPGQGLAGYGIRYWLVVRQSPRPLRIHNLEIDLGNPRIELAAVLADDPDGEGPATSALESPLSLARRAGALAMVNANPWQALPDAAGRRTTWWRERLPVEVLGLAASGGRVRSAPAEGHCGLYVDSARRAHIGTPPDLSQVREGLAGFRRLIQGGRIIPPEGGAIHPRTAAGLDATGRRLVLTVADGRQVAYSEGLTERELAEHMLALGCRDAVNLDGGGSSIMILAEPGAGHRIVNDPSTRRDGRSIPRPIPVALVIRPAGASRRP